jgi:hypothetical protein
VIEYLFLCQIDNQKEMVEKIVSRLERAGYKPWLDENQIDEELSRQATFAIERSDLFLILLSAGVMDSDLVRRQFELADQAQIPIAAVIMQPNTMPMVWQERLAGRPVFDVAENFDHGLDQLIDWLEGGADSTTEAIAADTFGGGDYSEIIKLQDEEKIWSIAGYYWFKNWRTLTRVKALLTTKRLIFLWDMRDVWKWKPREYEALEEAFPISIALSDITEVKSVYQQKILFVAMSQAYAEIVTNGGSVHKYTLLQDFDQNVTRIRELVDRP